MSKIHRILWQKKSIVAFFEPSLITYYEPVCPSLLIPLLRLDLEETIQACAAAFTANQDMVRVLLARRTAMLKKRRPGKRNRTGRRNYDESEWGR